MPDINPTLEELQANLDVAAVRRWGAGRAAKLEPSLRRLAEALATVAAFPVPELTEPFPTGPEAPRG
jgi:hypothetical protein